MAIARRASLSYPRQWSPRQVPTWPVEINGGHALSAGLVSLTIPGSRNFLADFVAASNSGPFTAVGTPTIASTGTGPAAFFSSSSSYYGSPVKSLALTNTATTCAWIAFGTLGTRALPFANGDATGAANDVTCWLEKDASNRAVAEFQVTGTAKKLTSTGSVISDNLRHFIAGTYDGSNVGVWLDAVKDPSTLAATGSLAPGSGSFGLNGVPAAGNAVSTACTITAVSIYNRALSALEIAQLNAEPFAMLRPIIRRSYSYAGALLRRRPLIVAGF